MAFPTSIQPGFDFDEAKVMLEIAQQTYKDTPDNPPSNIKIPCPVQVPDPPGNWVIDTEWTPTETTLLDNFWQVLKNTDNPDQHCIAIRGTVDTTPSVLADLLLPLVKARIDITGLPFGFNLARDEGNSKVVAGVHAGFLLGLVLMLLTTDKPLLATLFTLALKEDAEIYITGHSQGASLALLLTSFIRHNSFLNPPRQKSNQPPSPPPPQDPVYKTWAFAPAKPGNDHYAYDLDQIASVKGYCFSVVNSQGWVPQVPLTIQTLNTVNTPNPVYEFSGKLNPEIPAVIREIEEDIDKAFESVWDEIKKFLQKIIGELGQKLPQATFALTAADLGPAAANAGPLDESTVSGLLADLDSLLLASLNYAKAGALVPVFGTPGGNPDDPADFFWQHHLCNYLFYLIEQYGPHA